MFAFLEIIAGNVMAATILAGVVALITLRIRSASVRHTLWVLVLLRLLIPPIYVFPIGWGLNPVHEHTEQSSNGFREKVSSDGISHRSDTSDADFFSLREASTVPRDNEFDIDRPNPLASVDSIPDIRLDAGFLTSLDQHVEWKNSFPSVQAHLLFLRNTACYAASLERERLGYLTLNDGIDAGVFKEWIAPSLLMVWLFGMLVVFFLGSRRVWRFEMALRDARPAPAWLRLRMEGIAMRLGLRYCPHLLLVSGHVPPLVWQPSIFRRHLRVILPSQLLNQLSSEQQDALLMHELAHVRRLDPCVRWLEWIVQVVYWWYPLLGWIRSALRQAEEECCDAWVISCLESRKAYATALLETVAFLDGLAPTPALASGAGPVHNLERRIRMIMRGNGSLRWTRWGCLALLGFAGLSLTVGPTLLQAQPGPREDRRDPDREQPRKEGQPKERDTERIPPKDGERKEREPGFRPGPDNEEMEQARRDLERARDEMNRAMERFRQAEQRLDRLMGRSGRGPGNPWGRGPGGPGGEFRPSPGGNERQIDELFRRLEDMQRQLDDMRRQMQRGPGRPYNPFGSGTGPREPGNPPMPPGKEGGYRDPNAPKGPPFEVNPPRGPRNPRDDGE